MKLILSLTMILASVGVSALTKEFTFSYDAYQRPILVKQVKGRKTLGALAIKYDRQGNITDIENKGKNPKVNQEILEAFQTLLRETGKAAVTQGL